MSLGTWAYGGAATVDGRPVGWSGHDDGAARQALVRAHEVGIDHWDTADVYGDGRAESLIGSVWDQVPRDEIFLATKVGWDPGPHGHHYHPEQIRRRLERSLGNLRTDRIDLYYFHRCEFGRGDRYLDDAVALVRRYRDQGKVRFIGLSDWSSAKVARYAERVDPDVVQPYRNVVDDEYEASDLVRWVEASGAGAAFFSPLKHGLLLGKYERPTRFPEGDMRNGIPDFRKPDRLAHFRRCRAAVEARFAGHPQPLLHALVGVLLHGAPSACVLLGMRTAGQVEAAAAAGTELSAEDARWVRDLYRGAAG